MNFAQPGWLALLIVLPLLAVGAITISRLKRQSWKPFVAPRLRNALVRRSSSLPRWLSLFFLITACAAMILALARLQGDAGIKTEKMLGRNVMLALDISKSMRVSDVKPDRLTQAKIVIYELLEALPNERIGLIGFAGSPHTFAPLTIDHSAVRETVDQIDEKWAPLGGSNLAEAIQLAINVLKKTGQKNNTLVIISDGEKIDGDTDAIIAEATQAGLYIIAIGVGTEDGGFVPNTSSISGQMMDASGRPVISRLQSGVLRKLAEETKGRFTVAGSGIDIPDLVKSVILEMDTFQMEGRERRVSIEFYQWLTFPAILFLMVSITSGTRWKRVSTKVALIASSGLLLVDAKASDSTRAKEALNQKQYEDAEKGYQQLAEQSKVTEMQARYRLGEATAAYQNQDFRAARTAYSRAMLSEDALVRENAHLGMGNTLFQLAWQGFAGNPYPTDSSKTPNLEIFDTLVKKALIKMSETEVSDDGDTSDFFKIESLITNWSDAIKHYDSAAAQHQSNTHSQQNRKLTLTYLKRLRELLQQEQEDSENAIQQAKPQEGPAQEGEDSGEQKDENSEGKNDKESDKESENKNPGKNKNQGRNGPSEAPKDPNKDRKKDAKDGDKNGDIPNESPEERAHRILKENADLEKGPLSPGRREFSEAAKDW